MFAGEIEAYLSEAPFRCSTLDKVTSLTHKSYQIGKACQGH